MAYSIYVKTSKQYRYPDLPPVFTAAIKKQQMQGLLRSLMRIRAISYNMDVFNMRSGGPDENDVFVMARYD